MNYRHAFHAGNVGDVLKHVVLVTLLDRLLGQPATLFFLDTHAGRGSYDLRGVRGDAWGRMDGRHRPAAGPQTEMPPEVDRYISTDTRLQCGRAG